MKRSINNGLAFCSTSAASTSSIDTTHTSGTTPLSSSLTFSFPHHLPILSLPNPKAKDLTQTICDLGIYPKNQNKLSNKLQHPSKPIQLSRAQCLYLFTHFHQKCEQCFNCSFPVPLGGAVDFFPPVLFGTVNNHTGLCKVRRN